MSEPGPLTEEAERFARAVLTHVGPDLPPEIVDRFSGAVSDCAVAGAGLLRALAEVAAAWSASGSDENTDSERDAPKVERIEIG